TFPQVDLLFLLLPQNRIPSVFPSVLGFPWPAPLSLDNHPLPSPVLLGLPKKMTLGGGGFPQPYQAAQLHLHWGSGHTRPGSEHTVDGHRYAGEIHVVHYSSRFKSFQEAASEPGGLAVLAAFLQVGMETNEPYQHILKHLSNIKEEGKKGAGGSSPFLSKLLPYDLGRYFRYNGSLTTPPCYQTVNWTVFNQTVRLSQEQVCAPWSSSLPPLNPLPPLGNHDDEEPIQNNFRLLQGLYGRTVLSSFHSLEKVQFHQNPSSGLSIFLYLKVNFQGLEMNLPFLLGPYMNISSLS
uniref:Carbonic anhydrase n=1 Tax=Laticauda laticaudata TaxID=8630 RepID=A0A8C5WMJ9_LATLA